MKYKKLIVHYYANIENEVGGVEIFSEELNKLFTKRMVSFIKCPKKKILYKFKIFNELISSLSCLLVILKQDRLTTVLVQHSSFLEIVILPILKIGRKKIILISHVGENWFHIRNKLLRKFTNIFLNLFVNKVLVISRIQKKFIEHTNVKNISTIINEAFILEPTKELSSKTILYLGRICKEKGSEDLIRAFSKFNKKFNNDYLLDLTGPTSISYKKNLSDLISELGIKEYIKINNPIYTISEKINKIDRCFFGVYPSYADAFPLSVIEFYARNKVCLSTRIAETQYFIGNKDLLFEPGDVEQIVDKMSLYVQKYKNYSEIGVFNKAKEIANGQIIEDLIELDIL